MSAARNAVMLCAPTPPPPIPKSASALARLRSEWLRAIRYNDPEVAVPAFWALKEFGCGDAEVLAAFRKIPNDYHPDVVTEALKARLRMRDWGAMGVISALYESRSLPERNLGLLGLELRFVDDQGQAAVLKRFLDCHVDRLREGASYALRKMCQTALLPVLVRCLDDADAYVRFNGLMGLHELADLVHLRGTPSVPCSPGKDAKAVEAWKEWWRVRGKDEVKRQQDDPEKGRTKIGWGLGGAP